MQLPPYVEQVRHQLAAAAALGDERTREIAATLGTAAAPAVRLAVLDALSTLAEEVTAALLDAPGSPAVTVRLEGDEVVVGTETVAVAEEPGRDPSHDGEATARISLRLSDALKSDIDAAAERDGVSVNTWLVRAASATLRGPATGTVRHDSRRVTGWVNG